MAQLRAPRRPLELAGRLVVLLAWLALVWFAIAVVYLAIAVDDAARAPASSSSPAPAFPLSSDLEALAPAPASSSAVRTGGARRAPGRAESRRR